MDGRCWELGFSLLEWEYTNKERRPENPCTVQLELEASV